MPFYDYKCAACGNVFEIRKGMNDQVDAKCPACGGSAIRIFNAPRTLRSNSEDLGETGHTPSTCSSCSSSSCTSCSH
jgi:putative FmdB family regulatory protein